MTIQELTIVAPLAIIAIIFIISLFSGDSEETKAFFKQAKIDSDKRWEEHWKLEDIRIANMTPAQKEIESIAMAKIEARLSQRSTPRHYTSSH